MPHADRIAAHPSLRFARQIQEKYAVTARNGGTLPSLVWLMPRPSNADGPAAAGLRQEVHQHLHAVHLHLGPHFLINRFGPSFGVLPKGKRAGHPPVPLAMLPGRSGALGNNNGDAGFPAGLTPSGRLLHKPAAGFPRLSGNRGLTMPVPPLPAVELAPAPEIVGRESRHSGSAARTLPHHAVLSAGAWGAKSEMAPSPEQNRLRPAQPLIGLTPTTADPLRRGEGEAPAPNGAARPEFKRVTDDPDRPAADLTPRVLHVRRQTPPAGDTAFPELIIREERSAAGKPQGKVGETAPVVKPEAEGHKVDETVNPAQGGSIPGSVAVTLPPSEVERISEQVVKQIERKLMIERQRRGL